MSPFYVTPWSALLACGRTLSSPMPLSFEPEHSSPLNRSVLTSEPEHSSPLNLSALSFEPECSSALNLSVLTFEPVSILHFSCICGLPYAYLVPWALEFGDSQAL